MSERRIYLLSNGFQPEYEIAFANGLFALWPDLVLVSSDNTLTDRALPGLKTENWRGSQKEGRTRFDKVRNLLSYWRQVAGAMRRDRSAIFHFNGLFAFRHPLANLIEALAIRLLCVNWWLTVHNIVPHDRDTPLRRFVNRLIYRLPDHLMVHAPRMRDELSQGWGVDRRRIFCIRHGIDKAIVADAAQVSNVRQIYDIDSMGRPIVLCFGNIAPYKGADLMLDAITLARCRDKVAVLILGRSRDASFTARLHAMCSRLPAEVRAQVIDAYVADEHVAGALCGAAAMALPYRHIDQSGVLFTARAVGLPVISTPVGSMAEELDPQVDVLADACTPKALAAALDRWWAMHQGAPRVHQEGRPVPSIEELLWCRTLLPYREVANQYPSLEI